MGIFNLFGSGKPKHNDPYWQFDPQSHFKPKINTADFFRMTGFDFGWLVLEPMSKFVASREHEIERTKSLSYGQKALYFWWYVDAQVRNGGFVQFYYNGYGRYAPVVIKALKHIGDTDMAALVQCAEDIYQQNKQLMDEAQGKELFGSDLYKRMSEMTKLDNEYYTLNKKTMSIIEDFLRRNPNECCVDEEGREFDLNFSGERKTLYPGGNNVKEIFTMQRGVIHGDFKMFYQNGNLQELISYDNGNQTGEKMLWFENGVKRYSVTRNGLNQFAHQFYYENGNAKKLEHKRLDLQNKRLDKDETIGEYKEWYENGQLWKSGTYVTTGERTGSWLEFHEDGSRKVEAEFKDGKFILKNCWNDKGEQTLKDGTGVYVYETSGVNGKTNRNEHEYKNYMRHGKQYSYRGGVLTSYQEMENGKTHGMSRRFYPNGKVQEETLYQDGKEVSRKTFPMINDPLVVTSIVCEMKDEWLKNRGLETADSYPVPINSNELAKAFNANLSLFDGYQQQNTISYNYFVGVDSNGDVRSIDFLVADNVRVRLEVEANMMQLKFKPATKNGKPVDSYAIVKHEFTLAEK